MKWIGLYLFFGVLWMMLEELIAIAHGNEGYRKFLKSVNALELLFVRVISVIIWPIPMTIWFRDLQASKKES